MSSIELGVLCARFSLGPGGRLGELSLCGDFIANAEAVDALEKRLCGCPPSSASIAEVVDGVFARPENFLLGVGPLETISQTILKGLPEHR